MSNDKFDNLLRVAIANLRRPEATDAVKERARGAMRAPLASLIDVLLGEQPDIAERANLEAIASLNQGRIEDLDVPAFQSYLIGRLGISEAHLRRCMRSIRAFVRITRSGSQRQFLAAARDQQGSGGGAVNASEIREQPKKRKK